RSDALGARPPFGRSRRCAAREIPPGGRDALSREPDLSADGEPFRRDAARHQEICQPGAAPLPPQIAPSGAAMNVSAGEEQLRDLIAEQAAEFYVAHLAGDRTRDQEQEFLRWLRTSPLHVAEYMSIAGIAKDLGRIAPLIDAASAPSDDEENIVAINPSAFSSEPPAWRGSERDVRRTRIVWGAVASLVVAAVAVASV